ncbi:nitroreductase [Paraflavitalea sp. CAU 1676]|uniref:nitroreductase family protein n=1 Tax=Paraflavitalea sp. CAU 1676 TaxID=3032598 RepID=UPI0023DBE317|nr:nitroreductase [Paraflavitalea sp. CAU 1676]MDF2188973.1 nitroreductase [Paraflavitalea sp. CAU 1676]
MIDSQSISSKAVLINELIRTRRSVFTQQFDPGKPIPDEIIWQILNNANWAPTHKRTEPWRFAVFSGEGRKILAEQQAAIYQEFAGPKFKQGKYEQMKQVPLLCSHIITIGMKRHADIPEMEEIAATAAAVQNMHLTAHAYGLGAYWSTGGITFIEEAKALFNLAPEDKLMGFFYLGYIKVPGTDGQRDPIEEKVHWIK